MKGNELQLDIILEKKHEEKERNETLKNLMISGMDKAKTFEV